MRYFPLVVVPFKKKKEKKKNEVLSGQYVEPFHQTTSHPFQPLEKQQLGYVLDAPLGLGVAIQQSCQTFGHGQQGHIPKSMHKYLWLVEKKQLQKPKKPTHTHTPINGMLQIDFLATNPRTGATVAKYTSTSTYDT